MSCARCVFILLIFSFSPANAEVCESAFHPLERVHKAEELLNKQLSPKQKSALEQAYLAGAGKLDKDGKTPADPNSYTPAQLKKKTRILKWVGFSLEEIQLLMQKNII